jgi:hypothetical protein
MDHFGVLLFKMGILTPRNATILQSRVQTFRETLGKGMFVSVLGTQDYY